MADVILKAKESSKYSNIIVDGSIIKSLYFLYNDYINYKTLTEKQYISLTEKVNNIIYSYGYPDIIVMLQCNPVTCLTNIHKRGRKEEESIKIEYLVNIDKSISHIYNTIKKKYKCKFITYDWNNFGKNIQLIDIAKDLNLL